MSATFDVLREIVNDQSKIEKICQLLQGCFIYVPGEAEDIAERNRQIKRDFERGESISDLAKIYYLSTRQIRYIIKAP